MYRVHPCSLVSQQTAFITKVSGRGSIKILDPFYSGSCVCWGMVVMTFACCRGGRKADSNCPGRKQRPVAPGRVFAHCLLGKRWRRGPSPALVFAQQVSAGVRRGLFSLHHYFWTCDVLTTSECYNKWLYGCPKTSQGHSSRSQTSNTDLIGLKIKGRTVPWLFWFPEVVCLCQWWYQVLSHFLPHSLAPPSPSGIIVTVLDPHQA